MPSIFDNINSDELSNYYNELNTIDPKELYGESNVVEDYKLMKKMGDSSPKGVLLSYGDTKGLMTVGVFMVTGYINSRNEPITEISAFENGFVVLEELEFNKDGKAIFKENGGKIVMPYKSFLIACHNIKHNNEELSHLSTEDGISPETVKMVDETIEEILAEKEPDSEITEIYLRGTSLDEAHAHYTGADGIEMGSNYTMFPFEVFRYLRLRKIREYEKIDDDDRKEMELMQKVPYDRGILDNPEEYPPELGIPTIEYYGGKSRERNM